jgi:sporulation protein YunB
VQDCEQIEYCVSRRGKNKAKNGRKRLRRTVRMLLALAVSVTLVIVGVRFVGKNINPVLFELSEANARSLTSRLVVRSVSEVMSETTEYESIVQITKDAGGKIQMLHADAQRINALTRGIVQRVQEHIREVGESGAEVPIGSLTGIPLFSGRGPAIHVKFIPVGSISCRYRSDFSAAGINQTLHKINADIVAQVDVVMPGGNRSVTVTTEVLIFESILIGEVPDTYLQVTGFSGWLE